SQLNGEVAIVRASFSLVPWPHFTLKGVKIESPQWGDFASEEVRIYPRLLPLLRKEISVKRVFVKKPVLDLVLRKGIIERGKDIFSYLDQKVMRMIPSLELEGGMVNILRPKGKEPFFTTQGLTGDIASSGGGKVRLELRFSCPWAQGIEIKVSTGAKDEKDKSCSLLATGTGVKIESVRALILEFLGKNETVQTVFSIIRGGELSRITFQGAGDSFEEALDFERNMKIRGTFTEGRILTPPGPLPIEGASGEFEIEEAVLRCWNADARLGRTTARELQLVVGLISKREAFHLDSRIDADAEDLTHYLPLIIKEEGLRREIASFREAQGRGKGRLVLGENINHIRPQVEVESFHCSFRHASSPGRISLDGGKLSLKNGKSVWKADAITWKGCRWSNIKGDVTFGDRGIEITVAKADLCGLHCKGSVYSHAGLITHSFQFWTEEADLSSTIMCLWGKDARIEGKFLLDGDMWAEGTKDPLTEASEGSLLFISKNGRIYHWTILSQLFGMLNVIGLFGGNFPDFTQQGFKYDQFTITGELRDGYIYLKEMVIDGPAMKIVGEGKIDLVKGEADIVVLLAPLKTVDTVMSHIPIVGRIVTGKNGTFISVPFGVNGPFDNPKVTLLPPEAVGNGLWGVLKRTLQAPVETFKTIMSEIAVSLS
ncbi:MAG: AsmA-like C-terminal domain-containing protein, partial [Desulfobacterales bacterium]|nr:AsmA-like C-terminal domain-containing protein [Desulfobacterales bacterium]